MSLPHIITDAAGKTSCAMLTEGTAEYQMHVLDMRFPMRAPFKVERAVAESTVKPLSKAQSKRLHGLISDRVATVKHDMGKYEGKNEAFSREQVSRAQAALNAFIRELTS